MSASEGTSDMKERERRLNKQIQNNFDGIRLCVASCAIFPQELIDETIGHLEDDIGASTACALVNSMWTSASQRNIFRSITISSTTQVLALHKALEVKIIRTCCCDSLTACSELF